MKKYLIKLITVVFIYVIMFNITPITFADSNNSESGIHNFRKFVKGQDIDYCGDIIITDAISRQNEMGDIEFCKVVSIRNAFLLSNQQTSISEHQTNIQFIYDGDTVKVQDGGFSTTPIFNSRNFCKTSSSEEIYNSINQSIVSQKFGLYKRKNSRSNWEILDEFHIDVICSAKGEINFNVDSLDTKSYPTTTEQPTDNFNNLITKNLAKISNEILKGDVYREVTEYDTHYDYSVDILNINDDRYKYVTREIHIKYKNKEGELLAYAVISANFRYNKDTYEVKCLSTSHEEKYGNLEIFMRTGNETRTYAGAYTKINIKDLGISDYKETLILKSNSYGNVISQFV